ncbi:MAG: 3-oxoacyl-ACP synthase III family protein [Myxococcota bacterium]
MGDRRLGITSTGYALGAIERPNSWWPEEILESWKPALAKRKAGLEAALPQTQDPQRRRVMELMLAGADDPFIGIKTRPIHDPTLPAIDLELLAANDALTRSGVRREDIGLLVSESFYPDLLATNLACSLHERLQLPRTCFSFGMEGASNSFFHQLAIAEAYIVSGRARHALIVQSTAVSRLLPQSFDYSGWFGDMATAFVVSAVEDGSGVYAITHITDGSMQGTLLAGTPGKQWHEGGPSVLYTSYAVRGRMFEDLVGGAVEVGGNLFADVSWKPDDIDFYACHQGFTWMRQVTQDVLGMNRARSFDTFSWTGNNAACSVPIQLALAEREGVLRPGDKVVIWGGGSGITRAAVAVRWRAS